MVEKEVPLMTGFDISTAIVLHRMHSAVLRMSATLCKRCDRCTVRAQRAKVVEDLSAKFGTCQNHILDIHQVRALSVTGA